MGSETPRNADTPAAGDFPAERPGCCPRCASGLGGAGPIRLAAAHAKAHNERCHVLDGVMQGRFVSYLRVSTDRQGRSGLGLEAQRADVQAYLNGGNWTLLDTMIEVESGKVNARLELARALALCRLTGATLIVAKLDRLSRDAHFLLGLQAADVPFVAVDMPHATPFTVGIMALVAQQEREMISARTKAALAAAKARGRKLGGYRGGPVPNAALAGAAVIAQADAFASRVQPIARELQAGGKSLNAIAAELSARGIRTARGGKWTGQAVKNAMAREAAA